MGQGRLGAGKGKDADRSVASAGGRRCDLCRSVVWKRRQSGRGPVPPAPAAGNFRRDGGDGSVDRPRARDGWRLLVRPEPIQPRDPSLPAARLVVSADLLFIGTRQWLYALDRRGRG